MSVPPENENIFPKNPFEDASKPLPSSNTEEVPAKDIFDFLKKPSEVNASSSSELTSADMPSVSEEAVSLSSEAFADTSSVREDATSSSQRSFLRLFLWDTFLFIGGSICLLFALFIVFFHAEKGIFEGHNIFILLPLIVFLVGLLLFFLFIPKRPSLFEDVWINVFIFSLVIILFRGLIMLPFEVKGTSMEPNLHAGERIFVDLITPRLTGVKRGDIIVFTPPVNVGKETKLGELDCFLRSKWDAILRKDDASCTIKDSYVKRVIGLPGDTVMLKGGLVYVTPFGGEKKLVNESFLSVENKGKTCYPDSSDCQSEASRNGIEFTVEDGAFFVLGDNRQKSSDSRQFAHSGTPLINQDDVAGVVRFVFFSPPEITEKMSIWGYVTRFFKSFKGVRIIAHEGMIEK